MIWDLIRMAIWGTPIFSGGLMCWLSIEDLNDGIKKTVLNILGGTIIVDTKKFAIGCLLVMCFGFLLLAFDMRLDLFNVN